MGNKPTSGKKKVIPLSEFYFTDHPGKMTPERWHPAFDLCEGDNDIVITMEVPGVEADDIHIYFKDDTLIIEGKKREPEFTSKEKMRFICLERGYGAFQKVINSKWVVDPKKARATLRNGVLIVKLPKRTERRESRINIAIQTFPDE